jgi:hypothetical protein
MRLDYCDEIGGNQSSISCRFSDLDVGSMLCSGSDLIAFNARAGAGTHFTYVLVFSFRFDHEALLRVRVHALNSRPSSIFISREQ